MRFFLFSLPVLQLFYIRLTNIHVYCGGAVMSSIHGPSQCDVSLSVTKRSDQGFTQRLQKSIGCKVIGCEDGSATAQRIHTTTP